LLLLPCLVGLLGIWCGQALLCRAETPNDSRNTWQTVREFVRLRVHVYLTLALLPLLAIAAFQWLAQPLEGALGSDWSAGVLGIVILLASLAVLPDAVATAWQTRRLDPSPFRQSLIESAAALQVRFSDIRLWPTGGRVSNALVLGSIFPRKLLVLSDGLVDALTAPQLAMVVAHEAAHVQCRHLRQRTLLLAAPLVMVAVAVVFRSQVSGALPAALVEVDHPQNWLVVATLGCGYAIYVYFLVGWFSRRVETEADLRACGRQTHPDRYEVKRSAVADYSAALLRLAEESGHDPFRRGWLHPSLGDRILFLNRVSNCPALGAEFLKTLRSRRRFLMAAWVATLCLLMAL
jgi:Zn-dependent protease with chaperone function